MDSWQFIQQQLSDSIPVVLLVVLYSEGSSPGRQGFKMVVSAEGKLYGTIGGGIMEQKLATKAKKMLSDRVSKVQLLHQYHDKQHATGQSGMICSGKQLIAFFPLGEIHLQLLKKKFKHSFINSKTCIRYSPDGIQIVNTGNQAFQYKNKKDWFYTEHAFQKPVIHIIGAGHVGLALSEIMNFLGFYIKLYDDRQELNTYQQNNFATEKYITEYPKIGERAIINHNDFIVIMTVGYRTDKEVLKQLLPVKNKYLGLLGSTAKVAKLFNELLAEGYDKEMLANVHAPVGIANFSKTAAEIAVSIAAEIIMEKNKNLTTGRK